jgi:pSer/pThr/pTyr-binding forkhead associated (FHA) protein
MAQRVILLATRGGLKGHEFEFCDKVCRVVGRSCECDLHLPSDDLTASRRHCLLDIDPPAISVFDLASRNGTYVNGEQVQPCQTTEGKTAPLGRPLKVGDELHVGHTVLRVWIIDSPEGEGTDRRDEATKPVNRIAGLFNIRACPPAELSHH